GGALLQPERSPRVASCVDRRFFRLDRADHALTRQRGAIARDRHPWHRTLLGEVERPAAEVFAAPMAEEDQTVSLAQGRWVVGELERADGPRLDPRASKDELPRQRAVVARPGADDKDARATAKTLRSHRRRIVRQEPAQFAWLAC